jgi:NAD(P)-dependent dehydrogenase (short-subunit alcohol dehydrogenase family)
LTKADAKDYAKYKIRVNSVHPGFVWTPMVEEHIEVMAGSRERLDAIFPMGSMGEAIDIANGILFLISQESKFMTGSELVMDGGLG